MRTTVALAIHSAQSGIRKENVFGDADPDNYWNPFVELLDRELTDAGDAAAGRIVKFDFGWHDLLPGNRVPYVEVCPLDFDRLTCLNFEASFALRMGTVRLGEIPEHLLAAHCGLERVQWIIDRCKERKSRTEAKEDTK